MTAAGQYDPGLYNKGLAPVPPAQRTWGLYNYASLWVAMSVCIPTYMLASGLIAGASPVVPSGTFEGRWGGLR